MRRIILHWSAGRHNASATDIKHYHYIVEGDGTVVAGNHPVSANESTATPYAAHTRGANTGAIGVSFAAMHGAKERPFNAGKYPITQRQVDSMVQLVARLSIKYKIPIDREHVLSHAEVQPTLGIKQRGKWDVAWLPGMETAGDPVEIGDKLRAAVRLFASPPIQSPKPKPKPQAIGFWAAIFGIIFGAKK
jgi:hypothetical protein